MLMKSPLAFLLISIVLTATCLNASAAVSSHIRHNGGGIVSAPAPEGPPPPAYTRDGSWKAITNKIGQLSFYREKNTKEHSLLNLKIVRAEMAGTTNQVDSARLDQLSTYIAAQSNAMLKLNQDKLAIELAYRKAGKT